MYSISNMYELNVSAIKLNQTTIKHENVEPHNIKENNFLLINSQLEL